VATNAWDQFEAKVKQIMDENGIVGAAVAVARDGETIYSSSFGLRSIEQRLPVNQDTIFGVASISKSFTALAMSQLQDRGLISLDDPVVRYLPEFRLKGMHDMSEIKLFHILSHTTGLVPMTRRPELKTFEEHLEYLRDADYELLGRPGEYFSYCNDTFLLNGAVIERVSGMPFRDYVMHNIVNPVGMQRTTLDIDEVKRMGNYTDLYVKNPETKQPEAKPWVELGRYEVGGGVRSNVPALVRYGQVYVQAGQIDGVRIVSERSLRRMWTPVYRSAPNTYYCLALHATPDYHGVTLVEHGGGQPGVSSHFGFVPERRITASVLTNVTNVPAAVIWMGAVNTALGLPFDTPKVVHPEVSLQAEQLARYTGRYKSLEGADLRVYLESGRLMLSSQEEQAVLTPTTHDSFVFTSAGQQRLVKFYSKSPAHKPWAAYLGVRMIRRVE